jgi:hypothetical protein
MVLLTRAEAARRAGVSVAELEAAIRAHELRATGRRGYVGIPVQEVDRWARGRHTAAQGGHVA